MDRHNTAFPQVTSPILIGIFVIYSVLKIVRQEVLQLDWCTEFEVDFGKFPAFVYKTVNGDKTKHGLT